VSKIPVSRVERCSIREAFRLTLRASVAQLGVSLCSVSVRGISGLIGGVRSASESQQFSVRVSSPPHTKELRWEG
jgi:hypothetical protein